MPTHLDQDLVGRIREAAQELDVVAARSSSAVEQSHRVRRRSELLRGFLDRVRSDPAYLPRHCSWCGRVEVGGEFVAPEEFLSGDLPERLRVRATHGICPECLEAVQQGRNRSPSDV